MRADNSRHIIAAARHRRELTRSKAIAALRELDNAGQKITFEAVAAAAHVSRSWLYAQPDIRNEITELRSRTSHSRVTQIPFRQRSSEPSLLHRLEVAHQRNRELEAENKRLRKQLSQALGHRRASNSPQ